ncbi:FecR family protein [Sphingobacterium sp. SGG-5]|uniref:FecR family protein n=1 Tax=Sphingobacterium sp. SGG-5 TaxID=2710881 RepID=UPI0013EC49DE|nr:FecR family protein [Sphingobacterium sp. SGG-5]NGM62078.1 FecR family protein [Sphingobacterium sp. SGG-5]
MSNHEQLKELIIRYHQGRCSVEEVTLLRSLLHDPDNQYILEDIYDDLPEENIISSPNRKEDLYKQIIHDPRIIQRTENNTTEVAARVLKRQWMVAAAVILILTLPFIYYKEVFYVQIAQQTQTDSLQYAIVPGGDRAHIVLEDGRAIDLEQIEGDTIIQEKGFAIVKNSDGSVYYRYDHRKTVNRPLAYNTIITPKGGQYQIMLPDGTHVWLNAESSLKYPVFFEDDMRQVELKGEGYFEVAKRTKEGKSIPFIVQARNQRLEVLGTIFNIDSYHSRIKTTLVEGKVRLGVWDNPGKSVVLKPNEQSIFSDDKQTFAINQVDPLYATAWKDGNFSFHRSTIREVMESISRWYDVEIDYRDTFSNDYFTGTISRFEQIDKLLKSIELTGSVHFKIEGRRIIVDK